jgi:hypothetical protein
MVDFYVIPVYNIVRRMCPLLKTAVEQAQRIWIKNLGGST